jgi:hypothetical protein
MTALARRHLQNGILVLYDVCRATWREAAVRWLDVDTAMMAGRARSTSSSLIYVRAFWPSQPVRPAPIFRPSMAPAVNGGRAMAIGSDQNPVAGAIARDGSFLVTAKERAQSQAAGE